MVRQYYHEPNSLFISASGDSALSSTSRLLATAVVPNTIQWYDVTKRKLLSTSKHTGEVTGRNVMLPIIFIGPSTVAVGSVTGNVSVYKSGRPQPNQVLPHNGKRS